MKVTTTYPLTVSLTWSDGEDSYDNGEYEVEAEVSADVTLMGGEYVVGRMDCRHSLSRKEASEVEDLLVAEFERIEKLGEINEEGEEDNGK